MNRDVCEHSVPTDLHCDHCADKQAAAELRRLHAENEAYGVHLSERMKDLAKVAAQRDALLEALKELTGHANERFTGGVWDRARAAIKAAEENT